MSVSALRWACSTAAPWCLAIGMVVSFTASAGVDTTSGYLAAEISRGGVAAPATLIGDMPSRLFPAPPWGRSSVNAGVLQARLTVGEPEKPAFDVGEGPRSDMKAANAGFPQVNRSHKGDPLVALRPALSRLMPLIQGGPGSLLVRSESDDTPAGIFVPVEGDVPGPDSVAAFEPMALPDTTLTEPARAEASPAVPSDGTSTPAHSLRAVAGTSSTPGQPRAVSLSSNTPAAIDAAPVEIAAAPVSAEGLKALRGKADASSVAKDERPDYASLIDPDHITREQRCLAEAVYFEARSEPEAGQAAVAQVVLNRVKSGLYPTSICGVVYQNRHRHLACQFTFACEGKSLRVTEPDAWRDAVRVAREVTEGRTYLSEVGGSTHYHANYVKPYWAKHLRKTDVIGRHVFYQLRPGQT